MFNSKTFQINVQYINSKLVTLTDKLLTIIKNERKDKNIILLILQKLEAFKFK